MVPFHAARRQGVGTLPTVPAHCARWARPLSCSPIPSSSLSSILAENIEIVGNYCYNPLIDFFEKDW